MAGQKDEDEDKKVNLLIASRSIKRPGRLNGLFDIIACPSCMKTNLEGLGLEDLEVWAYEYTSSLEIGSDGLYSIDLYVDCEGSEPVETQESDLKCEYCYNLLPIWMRTALGEWSSISGGRDITPLDTVRKRNSIFKSNQFIF